MDRGIDTWAALQFRRELNRAVMRFKEEHPGVLEARTAARQARQRKIIPVDCEEKPMKGESEHE